MIKILFRIISWLRWVGIVATSDINEKPNAKEQASANLRLFMHVFVAVVILLPQVDMISPIMSAIAAVLYLSKSL